MTKLAKKGLFVFIEIPKPPTPKKKKVPAVMPKETVAKLFFSKGELSVIEVKRQKVEQPSQEPTPINGQPMPDKSEGWQATWPEDPQLYVAGICNIPMSDDSHIRLFRVCVRPSIIAKKHRKLMQKLERLDKRINKLEVRQIMKSMGKRRIR
jgi:hypothetical protein